MWRFSLKCVQFGTRITKQPLRTFLSDAYYCREVWQSRLSSPILQKINPDILYHELEQRFQKTRAISAVDVDIFTNTLHDALFIDEALDLVHKLRLSADTGHTHESTPHALIRLLLDQNRIPDLLIALDDRLNYGLFLDPFTANILFDHFWKNKDYTSGAFIAGQIMLQEDAEHPINIAYGLAHCYNYLLNPSTDWPQAPRPEEPEEEIKVRVRFLRNPYDDEHFDLKEPHKILGKTFIAFCKSDSPIEASFRVLGSALAGKTEAFNQHIKECKDKQLTLIKSIIDLVPEDLKNDIQDLKVENWDSDKVNEVLQTNINQAVAKHSEKDIANQCKTYESWVDKRLQALEAQRTRLDNLRRLQEVEKLQKELREKEQKLWFFENEEDIELAIEEAKEAPKDIRAQHSTNRGEKAKEEEYVPPEVKSRV